MALNAYKTQAMAFFSCNPLVLRYNGTPLENVQEFQGLSIILSHNGNLTDASNQMACNLAGTIWRICSELGIKNRKHAILWIFQVFKQSLHYCEPL